MALARVQASAKATQASATSITFTMATPPTVGNGLLVFVHFFYSATPTLTCADNRGNAYTLAVSQKLNTSNARIYVCPIVTTSAAPFQITVSAPTGAIWWVAQAVEVSGVGSGLAIDKTISATGTSAAPATGATAALTASEVVQAASHAIVVAQASITVVSATPTWFEEFQELTLSFIAGEANTRVVTSATGTTPSCSWTDVSSGQWSAVLAAFSATAPAAVATAQPYVWGPI